MPPKKKVDVADGSRPSEGDIESSKKLSVEDFTLPKTMILRLSKGVLPANTQIQKDALTALLRSATVFVNYLASSANDRASLANKKTIRPDDVMEALDELEFNFFAERVDAELKKYTEIQNNKRNDYRRRVKEDQKTTGDAETGPEEQMDDAEDYQRDADVTPSSSRARIKLSNGGTRSRDSPPVAKKARTSLTGAVAAGTGEDDDGDETLDEDDVVDDTVELEEVEDEEMDDDDDEEEEEEMAGEEDESGEEEVEEPTDEIEDDVDVDVDDDDDDAAPRHVMDEGEEEGSEDGEH